MRGCGCLIAGDFAASGDQSDWVASVAMSCLRTGLDQ